MAELEDDLEVEVKFNKILAEGEYTIDELKRMRE